MAILTPVSVPALRSERLGLNFNAVFVHCGIIIVKDGGDRHLQDKFVVTLSRGQETESFEFFTGIGHRKPLKKVCGPEQWRVDRAKKIMDGMSLRQTDENYELAKEELEAGSTAVLPKLDDVLSCLVTDAEADGMPFEGWCSYFGYDSDSRKALATYEACKANAGKLKRLGVDLESAAKLFADY